MQADIKGVRDEFTSLPHWHSEWQSLSCLWKSLVSKRQLKFERLKQTKTKAKQNKTKTTVGTFALFRKALVSLMAVNQEKNAFKHQGFKGRERLLFMRTGNRTIKFTQESQAAIGAGNSRMIKLGRGQEQKEVKLYRRNNRKVNVIA